MDQDSIRELLKGHEDILTAEAKKERAFYEHLECVLCGRNGCEKKIKVAKVEVSSEGEPVVVDSPFNGGILPEGYAHCIHCDTSFNPYTGLIYKTEASMIHGPE